MIKITLITSILVFLFSIPNFPQETLEINVDINWDSKLVKRVDISKDPNKTKYISFFSFSDASYLNTENHLPYYTKVIPLSANYSDVEIIVENEKFTTLKPVDNVEGVMGYNLILSNLNIEYSININRREPFLYVYFIPIRRNSQTNRLERLEQCSITIKLENKKSSAKNERIFKSASQSVLSTGEWYKVKIEKDGIYKITYDDIVNLGFSNPQNIRVYGNAGGLLPFNNDEFRYIDLQENSIWIEKGADNVFNSGDYILFFGQSPHRWNYDTIENVFEHKFHLYSKHSYYFLTTSLGQSKQVQNISSVIALETSTTNQYNFRHFHETENENIIASGRRWFGEHLNILEQYDTTITIQNLIITSPIKFKLSGAASSLVSTIISVNINGQDLMQLPFAAVPDADYGDKAKISEQLVSFSSNTNIFKLNFEYSGGFNDRAWIDYFEINARKSLKYENAPMVFSNENQLNTQVLKFNLTSDKDIVVWKISDIHAPQLINLTKSGTTYSFKDNGGQIDEYIMFSPQDAFIPTYEGVNTGTVANQDLLGLSPVDYIIITLSKFKTEADRLAKLHKDKSNLTVAVVTLEQIYNEFSSGAPDVNAIRDFIRNQYWKTDLSHPEALKYVLLFGDGAYDNRDMGDEFNTILTYQSANSIHEINSFVGDDFFSFLDDNEGDSHGGMDIGIGRFTANTLQEAEELVNKVETYLSPKSLGAWRNRICFVGDDQDDNEHFQQAESLANMVLQHDSSFIEHKIYLDAYKQTVSSSGPSYPEVNRAITDNMNRGILIYNYSGHGGPGGMAHERIITVNDIIKWHNNISFPLFITATCEFSRFDDGEVISAGEYVLLNPTGGGIALLTTTRLAYINQNFELNTNFFKHFFLSDSLGEQLRLGDLVMRAKNETGGTNKRNFTLLGDPALKINVPQLRVEVDSVNGLPIATYKDTISAFEKVTISGHVEYKEGGIYNTYSGTVYPVVFDKEQTLTTLGNDKDSYPESFRSRNNIIFRGKATVKDGRFSFSFIVPKDISYTLGRGLVDFYTEDGVTDGKGYSTGFYIGGESGIDLKDNVGPQIELYMNDSNFVSGGVTNQAPVIIARLVDENGINTSTTGIGHDIVAVLDDDLQNVFVLNEFYESDKDSYKSGSVKYQLSNLDPGAHTLKFKAWDIANNSSETYIDFIVAEDDKLVLTHVLNYPNPFSTQTWFMFEHNMPNTDLEVSIQILTVSGKVVKSIYSYENTTGFGPVRIQWNGRDEFNDKLAKGVYLYRLKVKTSTGLSAEKYEKLVIIN